MNIFDKNFKEIFFSQLVSIFGGLIAGTFLAIYTDKLLLIPGMLILIPGFLEMRGNISGTFASRISSGLFLGVVKPKYHETKLVKGNMWAATLLGIIVSAFLGLIAFAFTYFTMGTLAPKIILLPVIAALLTDFIEIPLTWFATVWLFKKGHDPNNIMGPFLTSTRDVSSIAALLVVMVIL
jgi:mgtE-like transporter